MPKPLLSQEEFDAELRRHGLVPVPLAHRRLAVWRNQQATVFVTVPKTQGFIPVRFVFEALKSAGIEYKPEETPE